MCQDLNAEEGATGGGRKRREATAKAQGQQQASQAGGRKQARLVGCDEGANDAVSPKQEGFYSGRSGKGERGLLSRKDLTFLLLCFP